MASVTDAGRGPATAQESVVTRFFRATEIDTRMLGMVGALLLIWLGFQIVGGIRSVPTTCSPPTDSPSVASWER